MSYKASFLAHEDWAKISGVLARAGFGEQRDFLGSVRVFFRKKVFYKKIELLVFELLLNYVQTKLLIVNCFKGDAS